MIAIVEALTHVAEKLRQKVAQGLDVARSPSKAHALDELKVVAEVDVVLSHRLLQDLSRCTGNNKFLKVWQNLQGWHLSHGQSVRA
jgi:hypothetical protein